MINFTKGDILASDCQALVNTVNTVGVMGKGIALQFKKRYPANYLLYKKACDNKELVIGQLLIVDEIDQQGERVIINFPTKKHWRQKSEYSYIKEGLETLKAELLARKITSIAIPPLGCGHGGLDWTRVRQMIEEALGGLDLRVVVYEPNADIAAKLRKEEPRTSGKLTPARAMLLQAQYAYEREGEQTSLFTATKLAYFLQRLGEPLNLDFKPYLYGPYDYQVAKVMQHLNGAFITGMEQGNPRPFEPLYLDYARKPEVDVYRKEQLSAAQQERLSRLERLLTGFESAYALEILSTVDFLRDKQGAQSVEEIQQEAKKWSNRKRDLLQPRYIEVALDHLQEFEAEGGLFA